MQSLRAIGAILFVISLPALCQDWKTKPYSDWTEGDARQVLDSSPWIRIVTPTLVPLERGQMNGPVRRKGGAQSSEKKQKENPAAVPKLIVRWESALPMQEAELKAHNVGAPAVDGDHYVIAVYGIPRDMLRDDSESKAKLLKRQAVLTSMGRQDIKPSGVDILLHEDGAVVVYSFPKSEEITWREHKIDFSAEVERLKFTQTFLPDEMVIHGKLEL